MSAQARSRVMSKVKSKGTSLEMALRRALWHYGMRYRVQYGKERIDIAFPRKKVAVFVDGCFWHSCPLHGHIPKSNIGYWKPKLERNTGRAEAKDARLVESGWAVLHFWEHDAKKDPEKCVLGIMKALEMV